MPLKRPPPEYLRGTSSGGYGIPSDRQPGIEQANIGQRNSPWHRLPMPRNTRNMPSPGEYERMPMPWQRPPSAVPRMPMPMPDYLRDYKYYRKGIGSLGDQLGLRGGINNLVGPLLGMGLGTTFDAGPINDEGDQAAVDPSDWRVLQQILGAGGNPDDYLETAMGPVEGIMGLV